MDRITQLRDDVAYLLDELRAIHAGAEDRALNEDEDKRFADGQWLVNASIAEGIELEKTAQRGEILESYKIPERVERGTPAFIPRFDGDPLSEESVRTLGLDEAFKRGVGDSTLVSAEAKETMTRHAARERTDSAHMAGFKGFAAVHGNEDYCRGFFKMVSGATWDITERESYALRTARQWCAERGLSTTAANGGSMIPTFLDPSVVLTNVGVASGIRAISRNETGLVNTWNGVSSAGVTFAWSTEGGDSSDVAATYVAPTVPAYKWHGTIPVTIEAFEDIQGLGDEVAREIADGRERLLGAAFATGTGSGQPTGITTAIALSTGRVSAHSTNSAFTTTDLQNAFINLGARYQPNASWVSSLTYANRVRAFGTTAYADRSTTLAEGPGAMILGRPWYEASDMTTLLSTVTNNALVYGDWSNYLIYDRIGTEVEFINHLFSAGNALPNGRRGWYAYGRTGADSINDTGFVLSQNPGA
jgi:HK97 family phage major capsid protein